MLHLLAYTPGDYAVVYYVEDITGIPLYDTCMVHVWSVGIEDIGDTRIQVLPNPVRDHFTITIKDEGIRPKEIRIYSADGEDVMKMNYRDQIDISDMNIGLYLLEVVDGEGRFYYSKFVVSE